MKKEKCNKEDVSSVSKFFRSSASFPEGVLKKRKLKSSYEEKNDGYRRKK